MNKILIHALPYQDPITIFSRFAHQPGAIFFDSAQTTHPASRYSFIAVDPFATLISKNGKLTFNEQLISENLFEFLKKILKEFSQSAIPNPQSSSPFQGGIAGYFGYDLGQYLEKVPLHRINDMQLPDLILGCYDLVIAFDHHQQKTWIYSSGLPEQGNMQKSRAQERINWLLKQINRPFSQLTTSIEIANLTSNFSQETYYQAIAWAKEYIYSGDVYQVNLAQRFSATISSEASEFEIYKQLRLLNPAPFAAYLNFAEIVIASVSPERFLQLRKNTVTTSPIKGTKPRGKNFTADQKLAAELLASEKDRAENLMIVDLMRNDLAKVCQLKSVIVEKLCELQSFPTVHHLVSTIKGYLREDKTAIDLLTAAFPGGSVTGTPKLRAMEIIAKLEPHARGPYCGSIGYLGFNGNMDTSIAIRTFVIKDKKISFHAGGAIIADSDAESEYQETLAKVQALQTVLTQHEDFFQ